MVGATQACIIGDPNHCEHSGAQCPAALMCDPCTPSTVAANGCVDPGAMLDLDPDMAGCQAGDDATSVGPTVGEETVTTGGPSTITSTTVEPDTTATEGPTDSSATTDPPPNCTDPDGTFGEMCFGNAPFCVGGNCVPCTTDGAENTTCTAPGQTACADSGACVLCTSETPDACGGGTPVCDDAVNECVGCSEHSQCAPSGCNLFTGACVEGDVVTVGAGQMQPNLMSAVAAVTPMGGGTLIVYDGIYNESVTVGGGAIVAVLAHDGDQPEWQRTMGAGAPQLRTTGGATVLIDGIDVRTNNSAVDPALRVDGASLWIDRSVIAGNDGVAVRAEGSGEVVLRNCFVGGAADLPALNVSMGSTMTVAYSSVGAALGNSNAILCDAGSDATVSDSIILTRGGLLEVDCPMFMANNTAANTELNGMNNVAVAPVLTTWFTSYNGGDFHLSATGQDRFVDIAEWNIGDPSVDIDGAPRSAVDGTPEHAGADLP